MQLKKTKFKCFLYLAYAPHPLLSEKLWTRPRWWPYCEYTSMWQMVSETKLPERVAEAEALLINWIVTTYVST